MTTTAAKSEKLLYTAKFHTIGGRDGMSRSLDGRLDVKLSTPGAPSAWAQTLSSFSPAALKAHVAHVAHARHVALPADTSIDAEVDLNTVDGGYFLRAHLKANLPGFDPDVAKAIVDGAHETCPYSKATRGNIDVRITLV
jgi:osmotically inducible protein OsmC